MGVSSLFVLPCPFSRHLSHAATSFSGTLPGILPGRSAFSDHGFGRLNTRWQRGGYRVLDNYEKKLRLQWYVLYLDAEMVWKEEHAIN
jgi:hypothetical protein